MPADRAETCRLRLQRVLDTGAHELAQLAALLQEERNALLTRDADSLQSLADSKQRCLLALEDLERHRIACLTDAGFGRDHRAMADCLDGCDTAGTLATTWQNYLAVAASCNSVNLANGAIIRARQQQVAATLSVLTGGQQAITYGPGGKTPRGASRTLGEA